MDYKTFWNRVVWRERTRRYTVQCENVAWKKESSKFDTPHLDMFVWKTYYHHWNVNARAALSISMHCKTHVLNTGDRQDGRCAWRYRARVHQRWRRFHVSARCSCCSGASLREGGASESPSQLCWFLSFFVMADKTICIPNPPHIHTHTLTHTHTHRMDLQIWAECFRLEIDWLP